MTLGLPLSYIFGLGNCRKNRGCRSLAFSVLGYVPAAINEAPRQGSERPVTGFILAKEPVAVICSGSRLLVIYAVGVSLAAWMLS